MSSNLFYTYLSNYHWYVIWKTWNSCDPNTQKIQPKRSDEANKIIESLLGEFLLLLVSFCQRTKFPKKERERKKKYVALIVRHPEYKSENHTDFDSRKGTPLTQGCLTLLFLVDRVVVYVSVVNFRNV